ncbi:hypothetical protein ACGFXC_29930 [Streptomyces sp. NPDC048507]|uniref:hypothetical protein n=1 Tax=Streptomyces sp. NPDC048507 TaxID=3365560 RepID=UPI00371FD6B5
MSRRPLRYAPAVVAAAAVGASLFPPASPFVESWRTGALEEARLLGALPRGNDLPGVTVVGAGVNRGDGAASEEPCAEIGTAISPRGHPRPASTRVVLVARGTSGQGRSVVSYALSEDAAVRAMGRIRAAIPRCAHYNSWWADLYTRHGLRPAPSPYRVGDEMVSYRQLDPPPSDPSAGGAPVPLEPGPLQEPGKTVTFVRTGGVITQYWEPVPKAVAEAFHDRFRRAATG